MAGPWRSLAEVRERVSSVHHSSSLSQQICFYDDWAQEYEQDVAVLEYRAPQLAAACLASASPAPPHEALVLDVACGTGLVSQELQRWGFCRMHGVDGSKGMLERAHRKGLYQELKQCILGQEPLPAPTDHYDAVIIVGALSVGQVPSSVVPELLRVTKPGGLVCVTTRSNLTNQPYAAELRGVLDGLAQRGLWEKVTVQEVEEWERATSAQETAQGSAYIPGVIYVYRKCGAPGS
ncbi:methyltransferase-like protein 27 [Emydura macquarii macquarii]|uniref:methyltransferase-like protein 27 n=1 Tax=Emydura macquarii macquarii TaxID=1129001 RepID=UPI00352B315D